MLPDETRVLSQGGLYSALGIPQGGGQGGVRKIAALIKKLEEKGIKVNDLFARVNSTIRFVPRAWREPSVFFPLLSRKYK